MSQRAAAVAKPAAPAQQAAAQQLRPAPAWEAGAGMAGGMAEGMGGMAGLSLVGAAAALGRPPREGGGPASPLDFSRLQTGSVIDADPQRRAATQRLLEQLAPALGLDLGRLRTEVHAGTTARLSAAGARGLQQGATILLHPASFRPLAPEGRYLLAHEAVHAAQRELTGRGNEAQAEREADELGERFAQGVLPRRPRVALRSQRALADTGAGLKPPPVVDSETVKVSRARELAVIRSALGGVWVSDGDVFDVLRILDSVPYSVVKPMLFALSEKERYWLADNINPPHVYKHLRSVLACYFDTLSDKRLRSAVDLKVLRALPAGGLSTEETEAAAWVIAHLSDGQRRELLASSNGPAIARIIGAPRPTQAEVERMARERDEAAKDEGKLFEKREAIAKHAEDESAKTLIAQIKQLLSVGPVGERDSRPSGTTARQALDLLAGASADQARFLFIAEQLEEAGLVDTLLELLPPGSFFDSAEHSSTLIALVRSRLPYKNEALVESLLSYGLFDWAVRDHEALFAYKLIKLLPLGEQYKFKLRDGGKWYLRLLDNLPSDPDTHQAYPGLEIRKAETIEEIAEMRRLGATEVDEKALLYNASQVYEKKLQQAGATETLQQLTDAFKEAEKGVFRDAEAKDLYRRLRLLGGSSLETGHEKPADQILREAVVHQLDSLGHIDELFSQLPQGFLFAEENRITTVKLMLARDPARVVAHARDLVSRGFTDWMVNDGEAWLAYQCIKALPADERAAFVEHDADAWSRIQGEMSAAMRQSRDLNLYVGDKAGVDRASVLGQLADGATWRGDNAALLGDLLRMAIAMTEHRFAFERSQEFNAAGSASLSGLVEKFRLWDPVKRPRYTADLLKGTPWHQDLLGNLQTLWSGLVTLWNMDVLCVDGKWGAKIDLGNAQDFMGGDLMGAQLADPKQRGAKEPLPHPDANKLTLLLGTDGRSAELILPELQLASANVQLGGSTLQTGRVRVGGLHLHAAYDSEEMSQPTQATARIDSLEANDLLLAKSSSMITVTRLMVGALRLAAGTVDTVGRGMGREGKGFSVPFPLLVVPLLAAFVLLALPVYLYRKIASLVSQGLEGNTGEHFAADVAQRTKAISFTLGSLEVESLTTSGGQHVGHAAVTDFALRVGLNKATRLRAEAGSLAQRIAALQGQPEAAEALAALQQRKTQVDGDVAALATQEAEYLAIMRQIRAGKLKPEQQQALQARLNELNFEDAGGAFIDIGGISASGIQAGPGGGITSAQPITLGAVHGEGGGSALNQFLALPTATDNELSRRSGAGERPDALLSAGQDGKFTLDLGDIHTGQITVGGGLRTVKDIDKQLAELEPRRATEAIKPLYESLQDLRVKALRHELLVQHGVSQLDATQLDEFRALRQDLVAQADLIVQSIDILHARLDADVATGEVGLSAESLRVAGVDAPARGIHVDEVIARGLGVKALPKGGLLGFADWGRNLQDASAHVDSLEISGARSKYHGLLFEKATLTGVYASMKDRGNLVEAGLKQFTVEGVGIAPRIGLLQQRLDGLKQKARLAAPKEQGALQTEITRLESSVGRLQQLVDARMAAYAQLEAAKGAREIEAAKEAVAQADSMIVIGLAQVGASRVVLDDFGLKARGAGDLVSDALAGGIDPMAVLQRGGVTVEGAGENHRLFKRFAVSGLQGSSTAPGAGASLSAEAQEFEVGETRLAINARKEGDSIHVAVPDFAIAAISLRQFLLTASEGQRGLQLWSDGASGIEGVRFKGSLRLDARTPGSNELADFRLAHVQIDELRVASLYGNGLGLAVIGEKMEVTIKSGAIRGIHADGINMDLPADPNAPSVITGKAGIEQIDDVIIGNAVAGAWSAHSGRINARALEATLLEDGGVRASVGSLSLMGFSVRGPDGWLRFSLADLGGKLEYHEGLLDLQDLHLGSFVVPAVHWKVGAKGFVEADQPVTVKGVRVKAKLEMNPAEKAKDGSAAAPGAKSAGIRQLSVSLLHIDSVEARHLVYQDEDNRIEIGADDRSLPKYIRGIKPLFLKNLDVRDLEWSPTKAFSKGSASLEHYEGSAAYEGLKSGMKAGIALTGGGMSAEVTGPGVFGVNLGKIDKLGGRYNDGKVDTQFVTGSIVGSMAMGPDFVEARDIVVAGIGLGKTTYTDGPRSLSLHHMLIDKVKLGKVRQNYAVSTDPKTAGSKTPTTLVVEGLELFDIAAGKFVYDGSAKGRTPDGKETSSTQHVEARSAHIKHLLLSSVVYDAEKASTTLAMKLDAGDAPKSWEQPLAIRGLAGTFVDKVADKKTTTQLLTDVEGGPLTADHIVFDSVNLGTAPGPDGKPVPVTRSRIDGGFNLTRLGLINPNLTITDDKGSTTLAPDGSGSIELLDLRPEFMPNGAMKLPIAAVIGRDLKLQRGGMTIKLPLVEVRDIALAMKGMGTEKGLQMLAAKVGSVSASKVQVDLSVDRSVDSSDAGFAKRMKAYREALAAPAGPKLIAEPLSGLTGDAEAEAEHINLAGPLNLPWDPNLTLPIRHGKINFAQVHPYAVNIRKGKLTIGNFSFAEFGAVDLPADLPGVHGDEGDYGMLNLRELVEGLYSAPPSEPRRDDKTGDLSALNNVNVGVPSLALGRGKMGLDLSNDGSLGPGDVYLDVQSEKPGQNTLSIPWQHLGERFELRMPHFHANSAGLPGGKAGPVDVLGVYVSVEGLAKVEFKIHVWVESATVKDIEFGDVTLLDPAKLKTQAAPSALEVNPKTTPGSAPAATAGGAP